VNVFGLIITGLLCVLAFKGSGHWVAIAVMGAVTYLTLGQVLVVGGFHFTAIRIVLLVAILRVFATGAFRAACFNAMDRLVLIYAIVLVGFSTFREGTFNQFVYETGVIYEVLLSYYIFRILLSTRHEIEQFFRWVSILIVPLAVLMLFEHFSGKNVFAALGGIGEPYMRRGYPRCQGPFLHAILAGVFGATLIPAFVGMWLTGIHRAAASVGVCAAIVITLMSNSSAPLVALICGVIGLSFWPIRGYMRAVRWAILILLVGVHFAMKTSIWYLPARLGGVTGGDGWHRSFLMEQAIRHIGDWWMFGTKQTGNWAATQLENGQADMTNAYLANGVAAGLGAMALFILLIVKAFQRVGCGLRILREGDSHGEWLLWGLGASLFAHVVTLISVRYFDQMQVAWWGFLACISSVSSAMAKDTEIPRFETAETHTPDESLQSSTA
jgi:hypothetical protein